VSGSTKAPPFPIKWIVKVAKLEQHASAGRESRYSGKLAMPYEIIILAATVILAVRHACSAYASNRSKCLVVGLAAVSLLAPYFWPSFLPLAALFPLVTMVLQFAVCFYVIFHQTVWGQEDELASLSRTLSRKDPSEKPGADARTE
jgi:hypothetical protein